MCSHLYRTLASNFPNGVVSLFDKDLRYTLTEGKGLAEVGLSKEFLEGKTLAEIFSPEVCEINLLDDILTINRAETGKLEFNPARIDIEQLCQQVFEEMRFSAGSQKLLTFSNQSEYKKAFIDKKLLRFIMTNLLSNAIKYSPKGGEVHLALTSERGEVTFQIRDRGIGIPLSDQPHLFEAFHRGENVGNIPGSGLGLTVVKKCVDLHGGRISVTSEVGVGTTFTVTIPFRGRRD